VNDYMNMRDIGKPFGLSPTKVGRELTECGYRENGKPTKKAFGEGMAVVNRDAAHPEWISYLWHRAKVTELLEDFGWRKVAEDE
jgi:hypothetical protein